MLKPGDVLYHRVTGQKYIVDSLFIRHDDRTVMYFKWPWQAALKEWWEAGSVSVILRKSFILEGVFVGHEEVEDLLFNITNTSKYMTELEYQYFQTIQPWSDDDLVPNP